MTDPSLELQAAIVSAVESDTALMALISGIYDLVPPDPWGSARGYISFGHEDTLTDMGCVNLDNISIQIDVWSRQVGRVHCKKVLRELQRVMRSITTTVNPIVAIGDPSKQIMRDPDGLTTHGFLRYEITMESHW